MKVQQLSLVGADGALVTVYEKRLSSRERGEPEAVARLRAEARLLAALGARATPRLVGSGEDERGPWLRTEKVPFPTLAERLEAASATGRAALEPAWVERATRAAFGALAELHAAADASGPLEIVHADLSPANVAFDDRGARAVLLDLDLARWRGSSPLDGAFRGTVGYCAPEIARGEVPTVASDVFALAATLLHAATGLAPRRGPSLAALLAAAGEVRLLDDPEVGWAELGARGPAHAALVRCLAHDATERPASARDVLTLMA